MKRLSFVVGLFLCATFSFSQTKNVVSAWNSLKPEYNELDKAKDFIDKATVHPKTQVQAKTWYYRGLVYHKLYNTDNNDFKKLHPNPLKEAFAAFIRAEELDTKSRYQKDIHYKIGVAGREFFNLGTKYYDEKKFTEALESFETVIRISQLPYIDQIDPGAYFNAAIAADQAGKFVKAEKYYVKSIDLDYGGPDAFHYLATIQMTKGDTVSALDSYKQGIEKYPEDNSFLNIQMVNYHLGRGELVPAKQYALTALEQDSVNSSLWFVYGLATEETDSTEAIYAYKRAIEIDPEYFDAYYNIGSIFYNEGVILNKDAMNVPLDQQEQYTKIVTHRDEILRKALPFYEKAQIIKDDFPELLNALKELYYRFEMKEKLEKVKARIEELN